MSAWNDFVKKIYHEGHSKNPNYMFKDALKDASRRKGEMGASNKMSVSGPTKKRRMTKKSKKMGRKSRRNRSH